MSVDLNAESGLHPTKPRMLFQRTLSPSAADSGVWGHTYAVFPDGKRFLFVDNPVRPEVRELRAVINWFEELKTPRAGKVRHRVVRDLRYSAPFAAIL